MKYVRNSSKLIKLDSKSGSINEGSETIKAFTNFNNLHKYVYQQLIFFIKEWYPISNFDGASSESTRFASISCCRSWFGIWSTQNVRRYILEQRANHGPKLNFAALTKNSCKSKRKIITDLELLVNCWIRLRTSSSLSNTRIFRSNTLFVRVPTQGSSTRAESGLRSSWKA